MLPTLHATPPADADVLVSLSGISKRFGAVQANENISFDVRPGEFVGLLGENGAGKSTLMQILVGIYQPDDGCIAIGGCPVSIRNPHHAALLGIGMVHQHFTLIPELTVAENIVLGLKSSRLFFSDTASASVRIRDMANQYGLEVDPGVPVWQLPVGVRQRVEILKVLYRGAKCLILDEPTAVLTPQETNPFLTMLVSLANAGTSILFVSHKLPEVQFACRRVVVLRSGRMVADTDICNASEEQIIHWMLGHSTTPLPERRKTNGQSGRDLLRVSSLGAKNDRGLTALADVTFALREGEIVGIAGVAGNGQSELVECLAGLRRATGGSVIIGSQDVTQRSPAARRAAGMAHIPEDRKRVGCILDMDLTENLILGCHRQAPYATHGWLRKRKIADLAVQALARYQVKAAGPKSTARLLSGGNVQKLILARELDRAPLVVLAAEPTRGLDVGAVEYTHQRLVELRDRGCGVLLVSTDLEEIMSLSDRLFVMHRGCLVGPMLPSVGRESIGHVMLVGRFPQE